MGPRRGDELTYTTDIINLSTGPVVAGGVTVQPGGGQATIPYNPIGVDIVVVGVGVLHLGDRAGAVTARSGEARQSFTAQALTITIRAAGEALIETTPDTQFTIAVVDDFQDYALVGQPASMGSVLSVTSDAHSFGASDFSLTLLFRYLPTPRGTADDTALIRRMDASGAGFDFFITGYRIVDFVALHFLMTDATGSAEYRAPKAGALYDGLWHSVAVTRTSGVIAMYIDAEPTTIEPCGGGAVTVTLSASSPAFVGSFVATGPDGSPVQRENLGHVEDVAFWRRALSPTDLIATMTNQLAGDELALVGLYELNQTLADTSSNGAPLVISSGAPSFVPIIHSFAVQGANDHVLIAMGAPTRTAALAAELGDAPLTRSQVVTVSDGAPFLYGALIKDDGTPDFPVGAVLAIQSPTGPLAAQNTDTAWVVAQGPSIRAFSIANPAAGLWTFTITAPAGIGFDLVAQTLPSSDLARTMVQTVSAAYPGVLEPATVVGLRSAALDLDWWDVGAAVLAMAALAAVAVIAAPAVATTAGAIGAVNLVHAVVAGTAVAAQAYMLTLSTETSLLRASDKCRRYMEMDPRPGVTVFAWSFLGFGEAVGHASMQLTDLTYISWWPNGIKDETTLRGQLETFSAPHFPNRTLQQDVVAEKTDDFPDGKHPDYVFKITGLDEAAIKTWWATQQSTENYRVLGMNCSTTVALALQAGGGFNLLTPTELIYYSLPGLWHPLRVADLAALLSARSGG